MLSSICLCYVYVYYYVYYSSWNTLSLLTAQISALSWQNTTSTVYPKKISYELTDSKLRGPPPWICNVDLCQLNVNRRKIHFVHGTVICFQSSNHNKLWPSLCWNSVLIFSGKDTTHFIIGTKNVTINRTCLIVVSISACWHAHLNMSSALSSSFWINDTHKL